MTWILIIWLNFGYGITMQTIEMPDEQSCMKAKEEFPIKGNNSAAYPHAVCLNRKTGLMN